PRQPLGPGGVLEDVEHRLPRPIRGRARALPFGHDDGPALQASGDDAHGSALRARSARAAAPAGRTGARTRRTRAARRVAARAAAALDAARGALAARRPAVARLERTFATGLVDELVLTRLEGPLRPLARGRLALGAGARREVLLRMLKLR